MTHNILFDSLPPAINSPMLILQAQARALQTCVVSMLACDGIAASEECITRTGQSVLMNVGQWYRGETCTRFQRLCKDTHTPGLSHSSRAAPFSSNCTPSSLCVTSCSGRLLMMTKPKWSSVLVGPAVSRLRRMRRMMKRMMVFLSEDG